MLERTPQLATGLKVGGGVALAILVLPGILYAFPALASADGAFVVLSGSMTPFMTPGDVVFTREVDIRDVQVGDVVTFRASPKSPILITHRVIEVVEDEAGLRLRTQGDANNAADPNPVTEDTLVGRYQFDIPYWGHALMFLRSKVGYFLFILVPCVALILRELVSLYREIDRMDRERAAKKEGSP